MILFAKDLIVALVYLGKDFSVKIDLYWLKLSE